MQEEKPFTQPQQVRCRPVQPIQAFRTWTVHRQDIRQLMS
ncbi:hypothetical protein YQE_10734, partial [Dendroctonus ponderosae]